MSMSKLQPANTDAILGGQNRLTIDTAILGGIDGIKQRLISKDKEIQQSALREALKYDDRGLELLVEIWKNNSHDLKWQAFSLLRDREEEKVKLALTEYNPWLNLKCVHTWEQDSIAQSIAISPDGNTLFSGNEEKINVWDIQAKQQKSISFPYQEANTLAVTNDGKTLISRGGHTEIIKETIANFTDDFDFPGALYYVVDRPQSSDNSHPSPAENLIPQYRTIISHDIERGIISWNVETGEHRLIEGEYSHSSAFVITPCQQFIIYGSESYLIRFMNLKTGKLAKNFKDSKGIIYDLAISDSGKNLVGCGRDGTVKIWDIKTREVVILLKHKEIVRSVAISPDERTLVSGSRDKTVKVWNLQTHKIKFTLKGHEGWVYCVKISPDGNYIFSCSSDKTIRVWDLHTGECVIILTGHTELIHCLVVSPDGKTMVSSSRDKTIKVWQRKD